MIAFDCFILCNGFWSVSGFATNCINVCTMHAICRSKLAELELCFANIYVVWECWGGIILPKNCAKNDQYKPIIDR
uniref:Secreted protein n=1 Tax=Klebsiella phage JLBP1001 TaxID=3236746 RepID=A0AB39C8F2_9CAUD